MMDWNDGWGAGGWLAMSLMMLMMVAFWGGLIALIVWAVRSSTPSQPTRTAEPAAPPVLRAEEVLAERFARGEIDEEEFTRRHQLLQRS